MNLIDYSFSILSPLILNISFIMNERDVMLSRDNPLLLFPPFFTSLSISSIDLLDHFFGNSVTPREHSSISVSFYSNIFLFIILFNNNSN